MVYRLCWDSPRISGKKTRIFIRSRKTLAAVVAALSVGLSSGVVPGAQAQPAVVENEIVRPDVEGRDGDLSQGCSVYWNAEAVYDPRFEDAWSNRGFTENVGSEPGFDKFFQVQHYTVPQATPPQVFSRVAFATSKAMNDVVIEITFPEVEGKSWSHSSVSDGLFGPSHDPYPNTPTPPEGVADGNTITYKMGRVEAGSRFTVIQSMQLTVEELTELTEPASDGTFSNFFTVNAKATGTFDPGAVEGCDYVFGYEDATTEAGVPVEVDKSGEFNFPEGTEYSVGDDLPEGWTVKVDPATGDLVVTPPADAAPGAYADVEVIATVDGKEYTTTVRVSVVGDNGGSSTNDRCIPTLLAVGVPLALLIPVALGHELNIPGLDAMTAQAQEAIRNANTQAQQGLGVFDPEAAAQVEALSRQYGPQVAEALRGVGLLAGGALAVGVIADACLGDGEASSAGSSGSSFSSTDGDDATEDGTEDEGLSSGSSADEEGEIVIEGDGS